MKSENNLLSYITLRLRCLEGFAIYANFYNISMESLTRENIDRGSIMIQRNRYREKYSIYNFNKAFIRTVLCGLTPCRGAGPSREEASV